ncbi:unnamed protein product [Zymoseptoria tritici ST99CH_1A5]|uniref:G protein-coupled receptor GPR1/2/3 C-terminal domain-containing protein n=3 Tax=Zymoseptoria tritici TaxID=1047171 RepID=A0A2H1FJP7_ZYMTR|nr:unnamed protein product [Zymoseptoria tritici ST99CH_1E4]SMR43740.1 unnamed protein product [Zymoseptoria tritici ST99CH_3D1]SMY18899.1 unnamed protein product [Zymoseptoria tritici ST99CH_1A5]
MSDAPDSLSPLPPIIQRGLWAVSATAALSLTTTAALSLYLIYRIVTVKTSANSRVSRYSVLLLNLIFADFIQAVGFAFNIHWLRYDAIIDGSAACLSQGWFYTAGDVGVAMFTIFMAAHLFADIVFDWRPNLIMFRSATALTWIWVMACASMGFAMHPDFYARAGMWCFISHRYMDDRLWFHYLWIILAELIVVLLYTLLFIAMLRRVRRIFTESDYDDQLQQRANFAIRTILIYPIVYVMCTLPSVVARLKLMAGQHVGYTEFATMGVAMCSNGWVDAVLYTLTRRSLILNGPPPPPETHSLDPCETYRTNFTFGSDVLRRPSMQGDPERQRWVDVTEHEERLSNKEQSQPAATIIARPERAKGDRQSKADSRSSTQRMSLRSQELWMGLKEFDFDLGSHQPEPTPASLPDDEVYRSRNTTMASSYTQQTSEGSRSEWTVSRVGTGEPILRYHRSDDRITQS